jgi:predicted unusual protein kinase regulating ubiquinone biosynthesis (AarF/ABC1/UbiB family)
MSDAIPGGRLTRAFALAKLAARELPGVASRALAGELDPGAVAARASAERALAVLGNLRGLALKLGQTLSYVDGVLPEEATEAYQQALAKLQSAAPTVSSAAIRAEVARGLGRPVDEAFLRFDDTPAAAASIGQVHRGAITLSDGSAREVAVKVQFPGIADALGSDLKNLESLRPMIAVLAPGADTHGGMTELVDHLAAELDYVAEGENQMAFRALVAGRSGVSVPEVHRAYGARNVLVSDWVQGRTLRDVAAEGSQALRDAVGVTIFRTALGLAFNQGIFNTDPHPGNYLVDADGVVHLLDFGSVKRLPDEFRVPWRHLATLLVRGDIETWRRESASFMGMEAMDPRARERHLAFMLQSAAMVSRDEEITLDRARLRGAVLDGMKTAKDIGRELGWMPSRSKTVAMPPDMVMVGRMQLGLFAVLSQLGPRANWNRVLREELGM